MTAQARGVAIVVAVVGAESTGKSTLSHALAAALRERLPRGTRVAVVAEWLREWCESTGRTPQVQEQASILRGQHERITAAREHHDWVVADTTPLMTAVYSHIVFGDDSLRNRAIQLHAACADATLLTALDLPWQPDGHQRDGAHVREPVDAVLRQWLGQARLPYSVVHGLGEQRVANALAALQPLMGRGPADDLADPPAGLFTRLGREGGRGGSGWLCECCVPGAESALRRHAGR
ncbi:MAG: AAA family ATPase [Rubrivivax sp.]